MKHITAGTPDRALQMLLSIVDGGYEYGLHSAACMADPNGDCTCTEREAGHNVADLVHEIDAHARAGRLPAAWQHPKHNTPNATPQVQGEALTDAAGAAGVSAGPSP